MNWNTWFCLVICKNIRLSPFRIFWSPRGLSGKLLSNKNNFRRFINFHYWIHCWRSYSQFIFDLTPLYISTPTYGALILKWYWSYLSRTKYTFGFSKSARTDFSRSFTNVRYFFPGPTPDMTLRSSRSTSHRIRISNSSNPPWCYSLHYIRLAIMMNIIIIERIGIALLYNMLWVGVCMSIGT